MVTEKGEIKKEREKMKMKPTECNHRNTREMEWPDGGTSRLCNDCLMTQWEDIEIGSDWQSHNYKGPEDWYLEAAKLQKKLHTKESEAAKPQKELHTKETDKTETDQKGRMKLKTWLLKEGSLEEYKDFFNWIKKISRNIPDFISNKALFKKDKDVINLVIYTETNSYSINARLPENNNNGYLGCVLNRRKSLVGEDWTRGADLADGDYKEETFIKIMGDIISHELKDIEAQL